MFKRNYQKGKNQILKKNSFDTKYLTRKLRIVSGYLNKMPSSAFDYIKKVNDETIRNHILTEVYQSQNDIVKLIEYINEKIYNKQCILLNFSAKMGVGKTVSMFYLAHVLNLVMEIIYNVSDFAKWLEDFKTHTVTLIPDLATAEMLSRDWNTTIGKLQQKLWNTMRVKQGVVITAIPDFEDAEKSIRKNIIDCSIVQIGEIRLLHMQLSDRRFTLSVPFLPQEFRYEFEEKDFEEKIKLYKSISKQITEALKGKK